MEEKRLIDFGNYLLSDERKELTSKQNRKNVTDADLQNFYEIEENEKVLKNIWADITHNLDILHFNQLTKEVCHITGLIKKELKWSIKNSEFTLKIQNIHQYSGSALYWTMYAENGYLRTYIINGLESSLTEKEYNTILNWNNLRIKLNKWN